MKKTGLILIMALASLPSCGQKPPEAQFWAWFEQNEDMLFHLEKDQERTLEQLTEAMAAVHPKLHFGVGPEVDGRRDFVITADGLKDVFPAVEALHAAAPALPRWTFIKFRPRGPAAPMTLRLGDLAVESSDVEVAVEADGEKAGFTVFVKGYDESQREQFLHAVFLMLDHTIGEYDMETKVGFIDVRAFEEDSEHPRHSLADLPRVFDSFMER